MESCMPGQGQVVTLTKDLESQQQKEVTPTDKQHRKNWGVIQDMYIWLISRK